MSPFFLLFTQTLDFVLDKFSYAFNLNVFYPFLPGNILEQTHLP